MGIYFLFLNEKLPRVFNSQKTKYRRNAATVTFFNSLNPQSVSKLSVD